MKLCREEEARELFAGTAINATTEGQKHLGAELGSRSYLEGYVNDKVVELGECSQKTSRICSVVATSLLCVLHF